MKTLLTRQKRDANEHEIAAALRQVGAGYIYLDKSVGFDALVIYAGSVYLVEIKMPGKALNAREIEAHLEIRRAGGVVNVIHDVDEALHMVGWSRL
jgi:hypothetical protein